MNAIELRLIKSNGLSATAYPRLVAEKVAKKYSVSDELAILRQRDAKPEEFAEYNTFVEGCKAEAKQELGI